MGLPAEAACYTANDETIIYDATFNFKYQCATAGVRKIQFCHKKKWIDVNILLTLFWFKVYPAQTIYNKLTMHIFEWYIRAFISGWYKCCECFQIVFKCISVESIQGLVIDMMSWWINESITTVKLEGWWTLLHTACTWPALRHCIGVTIHPSPDT